MLYSCGTGTQRLSTLPQLVVGGGGVPCSALRFGLVVLGVDDGVVAEIAGVAADQDGGEVEQKHDWAWGGRVKGDF